MVGIELNAACAEHEAADSIGPLEDATAVQSGRVLLCWQWVTVNIESIHLRPSLGAFHLSTQIKFLQIAFAELLLSLFAHEGYV
jgi:hypothetical protein